MRPHHKYGDRLFMINQNATLSFNYKFINHADDLNKHGTFGLMIGRDWWADSIRFHDWVENDNCVGVWCRFEKTFYISSKRGADVQFLFRTEKTGWRIRINNFQFTVYDNNNRDNLYL